MAKDKFRPGDVIVVKAKEYNGEIGTVHSVVREKGKPPKYKVVGPAFSVATDFLGTQLDPAPKRRTLPTPSEKAAATRKKGKR